MIDLLRRNRDLRLLFFSQVISLGGDWFATVALLGLIGDLTHDSAIHSHRRCSDPVGQCGSWA